MDDQGNLMSTPEYGQRPKLPSYYYAEFLKIFEQQSRLEWEIKKYEKLYSNPIIGNFPYDSC